MKNGQARDDAPAFMATAFKHDVLTREDERRLLRTVKNGRKADREKARDRLIRSNLRFVLRTAFKLHRRGGANDVDDAFQEGVIGELKAIERFELDRETRLSTYAGWWVRHQIVRSHEEQGRTVRIPTHALSARLKLERAAAALRTASGSDPTIEQLAATTGLSEEKIRDLLAIPLYEPLSLDEVISGEDGRTLGEMVADETETPDDRIAAIEQADLEAKLRVAMQKLNEAELEIIRCRFFRDMTLVETADRLARLTGRSAPLSRERIRQIEAAALAKLRRLLRIDDLS